jgi:hypothetical protein
VIGRHKGKGYATKLVKACVDDAKKQKKHGVVMFTSARPWIVDKKIFEKNRFTVVGTAPPKFDLVVKKFGEYPDPHIPQNLEERAAKYPKGLTLLYTIQCPYILDAVKSYQKTAEELGIPFQAIEMKTAKEVQELSPSVYGTFNTVYNGKFLDYMYLTKKNLVKALGK